MFDRDDQQLQDVANMSSSQLTSAGLGAILGGLIILVCAFAFGGGSSFVRWAYGIITAVNVSFAMRGLVALHGELQLVAAFSVAFGLMILRLQFWSARTDRFFELRH